MVAEGMAPSPLGLGRFEALSPLSQYIFDALEPRHGIAAAFTHRADQPEIAPVLSSSH
jgi:hypothetical protein